MVSYKVLYTVKKSQKKKVMDLISEFIEGICNNEPDTSIYHAYSGGEESVEFIHVMTFRNEQAEEKHKNSSYCQKFNEELYPLCEKEPEFIPVDLVR